MEEGIEEENNVVFDRNAVEENRLGLGIKGIGHQRWLDHDQ